MSTATIRPQFTIITTTYRRPQLVLKSVTSVLTQTYPDWHLLLVIDDPVTDYHELKTLVAHNERIRILENTANQGKNYSVNRALDLLESESYTGHVVFLDDDDWLATDCLSQFAQYSHEPWLVSERYNDHTKTSLTKNTLPGNRIEYTKDMLLFRRFTGETTHCLFFPTIKNLRFPTRIKNAEEWLYFASVAQILSSFMFLPVIGTYSEGYLADGLSVVTKSYREKLSIIKALYRETWQRRLTSPYAYLYLLGRTIKTIAASGV